jgi:alpha,alpha-trehalase
MQADASTAPALDSASPSPSPYVNGTIPGPNGTFGIIGTNGSAGTLHPELAPLLQDIQDAKLYNDSKTAVDLPLNASVADVAAAYNELLAANSGSVTKEQLQEFVAAYLGAAGSELLVCTPADWQPKNGTAWLSNLQNAANGTELRQFAQDVHDRWNILCRQMPPDVFEFPERHSLLPLTRQFIVPGDRFRETYYWDSYWVIRGLLVSDMTDSATSMVYNLLSLLKQIGHVPNGARVYYLNRSQPPLLSAMVRTVYETTNDMALLTTALPQLVKEAEFWSSGDHSVTIVAADGRTHNLSRYYADWYAPRPESYREDAALAEEVAGTSDRANPRAAQLYLDLASGAESGWDYSSRWFADNQNLSTVRTTQIIPADLNAWIYQLESNIAWMANMTGDAATSAQYTAAAATRAAAIEALLWDAASGNWRDGILSAGPAGLYTMMLNPGTFASNYVPLWVGLGASQGDAVTASLQKSGLLQPGGIATTVYETGQQWDFPNGWPPLQHMIIEGLNSNGGASGKALSVDLAHTWVHVNYVVFNATQQMHEKYDVRESGVGAGGEYTPQVGFGWSNGVVLDFLSKYY